jgi:TIR domain
MKVFISWSGGRSRAVAQKLREWLPFVVPRTQPWLSSADIQKGSRWGNVLTAELEQAKVGIICVTPDNVNSSWLLYEAGALSKLATSSLVCTYLTGIAPSQLEGPLSQFQSTLCTKDDTLQLIRDLNRALKTDAYPDKYIEEQFRMWWPDLESALNSVQSGGDIDRPGAEAPRSKEVPLAAADLSDSETGMVRQLIHKALSNPQWNWRTPAAVAKESAVSDAQALHILRQMAVEGEVRFSPSKELGIVVGLTART